MKKFLNILSIFVLFLFCFSCSNLGFSEKTQIKITLPAAERIVSSEQPMNFVLSAINDNTQKESTAAGKSGETLLIEVDSGIYTVNLKAYAEDDTEYATVLFEGTEKNVTVLANDTTSVVLKLKRQIFTVTIVIDDVTGSMELNRNSKITISETPEKEGYTFIGWYNGDEAFDFETPITSDITLTAKWQQNSYKVIFVAENTTEQTVKYGEKVTKPVNPVKDDYDFLGWYNDDEAFDFETPITSDITLTAKWQQNSYKVTFVAENTTEQTIKRGEKVTKPVNPVKDGSVFLGWYNGDEAFDFDTPIISDITLTAKWQQKITSSVSLVFESIQDGKPTFEYKLNEEKNTITVSLVTKENVTYKFYSWLIDGAVQSEQSSEFELDSDAIKATKEDMSNGFVLTCIAYTEVDADIYSVKLVF